MQQPVITLAKLGPLPRSDVATVAELEVIQQLLSAIQTPVSDEDARELTRLFGPDDCFGLAWTLVHIVESAPGWPVAGAFEGLQGEWIDRLRERSL
jgi:hypothetical protein